MEVENENQVSLLVNDDFISFILYGYVLVGLDHGSKKNFGMIHFFIKSVKVTISKIFVVHEIPLSTAMLIAISISFTWEIDPFWVTEFVAHEIKVRLST
jgi:hypothetical protein